MISEKNYVATFLKKEVTNINIGTKKKKIMCCTLMWPQSVSYKMKYLHCTLNQIMKGFLQD